MRVVLAGKRGLRLGDGILSGEGRDGLGNGLRGWQIPGISTRRLEENTGLLTRRIYEGVAERNNLVIPVEGNVGNCVGDGDAILETTPSLAMISIHKRYSGNSRFAGGRRHVE